MKTPTHPGLILYSGFVEDSGLTISAIAKHLGFSRENLSRVLHGKSPITQNMALRLEAADISTARQWLSLQLNHDLSHTPLPKQGCQVLTSLRGTTLGVTRFIQPNTLVFAGQPPTTPIKTQSNQ